jgi:hypothetical protein
MLRHTARAEPILMTAALSLLLNVMHLIFWDALFPSTKISGLILTLQFWLCLCSVFWQFSRTPIAPCWVFASLFVGVPCGSPSLWFPAKLSGSSLGQPQEAGWHERFFIIFFFFIYFSQ